MILYGGEEYIFCHNTGSLGHVTGFDLLDVSGSDVYHIQVEAERATIWFSLCLTAFSLIASLPERS
jgi:hypothetical protein